MPQPAAKTRKTRQEAAQKSGKKPQKTLKKIFQGLYKSNAVNADIPSRRQGLERYRLQFWGWRGRQRVHGPGVERRGGPRPQIQQPQYWNMRNRRLAL